MNLQYHKSLTHLHIGCEPTHAYFIPYHSREAAATGNRGQSARFVSLCGEWDFRYYGSVNDVEDFNASDWEAGSFDRLNVPMNWQMALGRGYDTPHYTNHNYPFPIDPPHVPEDNPCGLYRRSFEVDAETLRTRDVKLVFEGVDSCFYVYINNRFAAYSQVSHTTTEITVNDYLVEGVNDLKVLVLKWCDGSYLEDQDKIRLSGIFREVYLLLRDRVHITDLYVRTETAEDLASATVKAEIKTCGNAEVAYELRTPNGVTLMRGSLAVNENAELTLPIEAPALWSDETPSLYTLDLTLGGEYIRQEIGIRRFEIKGKVIYINGKKVKGRGVNRHDSHPQLGYATPVAHMLRDLYILKAHNINMVRTSHYPNDPRFLEYCDRLGFYVCDETDLETHGMNDAGNWSALTDSEEWSEAYLDRLSRMFERDKNHACVLMWSLGNESGNGINHRKMFAYLKARDPHCIVHSDGVTRTLYFDYMNAKTAAERQKVDCDYVDVESRMYLTPAECLRYYVRNRNIKKPFFLCEYAHAMGNSPGDLEAYWQTVYKHDAFFGACVWEMADHSVDIGTVGSPKYIYGGDMGNKPHDGNFCIDGLLSPDRKPHSGMLEYKQVLRPCRVTATDFEKHTVTLRNMRFFTSLSDLDLYWTIERNGRVIREGRVLGLHIPPQQKRTYRLPLGDMTTLDGFCYLNLYFRSNVSHPWADVGYEVGFEQFEMPSAKATVVTSHAQAGDFGCYEDESAIRVKDGETVYTLDRVHGLISSIVGNGKELITTPLSPTIWRAPLDNDRYVKQQWIKDGFDRMRVRCKDCCVTEIAQDHICVSALLSMGAVAKRPALQLNVTYRFDRGAGVAVSSKVEVTEGLKFLPRFGFRFHMPAECEFLRYFGRGPVESYEDKRHASRVGLFASTVTDHFVHYIRPQENMAHTDTRWITVANASGQGLLATNTATSPSFIFNCSHYTAEQLTATAHDFELTPIEDTVVHIDYRQSGIGSNSCGARLDDCWRLNELSFDFAFRLQPVLVNDICPFEKCVQENVKEQKGEIL